MPAAALDEVQRAALEQVDAVNYAGPAHRVDLIAPLGVQADRLALAEVGHNRRGGKALHIRALEPQNLLLDRSVAGVDRIGGLGDQLLAIRNLLELLLGVVAILAQRP